MMDLEELNHPGSWYKIPITIPAKSLSIYDFLDLPCIRDAGWGQECPRKEPRNEPRNPAQDALLLQQAQRCAAAGLWPNWAPRELVDPYSLQNAL